MKNKIKKVMTNKYVIVGMAAGVIGIAVGALISTRLGRPQNQTRIST